MKVEAPLEPRCCCGVDLGATLTKVAWTDDQGKVSFRLFRESSLPEIGQFLEENNFCCGGITGGGASALRRIMSVSKLRLFRINEFAAWGVGSGLVLAQKTERKRSYLLVTIGTGTSVLLVRGMSVTRVGGTALGGGTLIGLGRALVGEASFEKLCALAVAGDRRRSDLLVDDVYEPGQIAMASGLTAASFGKLQLSEDGHFSRSDAAASLMEMIGENVALIAVGLASRSGIKHIVYAGSTLRNNLVLCKALRVTSNLMDKKASLPTNGEFFGALGAMHFGWIRHLGGQST